MDGEPNRERRGERRSGTGDSVISGFDEGLVLAAGVWSCSSPSFPSEQISVSDNIVGEMDSKPFKKWGGRRNGVGARRSGEGSRIAYVGPVKAMDYMYCELW